MKRMFKFMGEEQLFFDDAKSVKELIRYAFNEFDYYEPAGMEVVTIFQPQSRTYTGWFTTDTSRLCVDEIEDAENLRFAYHMPNVFYFAEGGWGHHMPDLENHPQIDNPVVLHLRFDDFNHSVVINGKYTFETIISFLKQMNYLSRDTRSLRICAINPYQEPYLISFDSELMRLQLTEFEKRLPDSTLLIDIY